MIEKSIAVLLMAYGCPDSLDDIEKYYTHIRMGKKPSPEEVERLRERYIKIGGKSPLLEITYKQAQGLENYLNRNFNLSFKVCVGMKHGHPFIFESVEQIVSNGHMKMIAMPLTPHYSKMTTESYQDIVKKSIADLRAKLKVINVKSWAVNKLFIKALTIKLKEKLNKMPKGTMVVFTAHSLPKRILRGNFLYTKELEKTCKKLAKNINLKKWKLSYQSAGNKKGKWLGPDILETLNEFYESGLNNILICPVGFVADNLEILYDIDVECRNFARAKGMNIERTESLNVDKVFIEALASIVRDSMD